MRSAAEQWQCRIVPSCDRSSAAPSTPNRSRAVQAQEIPTSREHGLLALRPSSLIRWRHYAEIRSSTPGTDAPKWPPAFSGQLLSIFRVWFAVDSDAPMAMTLRVGPLGRRCLGNASALPQGSQPMVSDLGSSPVRGRFCGTRDTKPIPKEFIR